MTDTADTPDILDLDGLLQSAAEKYDLDPEHLRAMANTESRGNAQAVSPKGAGGVMQIMPDTAKMLGVRNVFDPAENIDAGARYYRSLLDTYKGDETKATAAYNAGPGAVDSWGGVPPYRETKNYLTRIQAFKAKRANSSSTPDQPDDVDPASLVSSTPDEPDMPDTPDVAQAQPQQPQALPQGVPAGYEQPVGMSQLGALPTPGMYSPNAQQIAQGERRAAGAQMINQLQQAPPQPWYAHTPQAQPTQDDLLLNTAHGVFSAGKGVGQVAQAMPFALPNQAAAPQTYRPTDYKQATQGMTNIVGGGLEVAAPAIGVGLRTAPGQTIRALGQGVLGSKLAAHLAKKAGLDETYQEALALVGGLAAGSEPGMKVVEGAIDLARGEEVGGVRFGAPEAPPKSFGEMSDAELTAAYNTNEQAPPKNYQWVRQEIANEVLRRQGARNPKIEGGEQPQGGDRGQGPLFEQPEQPPAGRQSSLSTVVSREPFQPEVLPTDEELQREVGQQPPQPPEPKPQEPEPKPEPKPEPSEQEQQQSALAQERFGKDYGELTGGERFRVDDELRYRQWEKDFEESRKGLGEREPEKQEQPEEAQDPIAWARGEIDAGNDLSVGAIQNKFNLGYLEARGILRDALAEPKPATIEPRDKQQPERPEKEDQSLGIDAGGEGGERGGVSPAAPGALYTPGSRVGKETAVLIPGTKLRLRARYVWKPVAELASSHSGLDFSANPDYPLTNEREYTLAEAQKRVMDQAEELEPEYLITDNPDMTNGPPAWETVNHPETGNAHHAVLAGNSRVMTAERAIALHPGNWENYNELARQGLSHYGIDPAVVDDPNDRRPHMLTREVYPLDPATRQAALASLNKTGTAVMSPEERAMADSKRVSQDTLDHIISRIEQYGEKATLQNVLDGEHGAEIVDKMMDDGIISDRERPGFVTVNDKNQRVLTPEGKSRIARLMVGRFFEDVPQYDATPDVIRNKLALMAPSLASLENRPDWDLINGPLREGLRILREAQNRGVTKLEDLNSQQNFEGKYPYTDQGIAWAYALASKANSARAFQRAARAYANMELQSRPGRDVDMFAPPPVERNDAYRQAWGDLKAQKGIRLIGGKVPKAPPKVQESYEGPEVSHEDGETPYGVKEHLITLSSGGDEVGHINLLHSGRGVLKVDDVEVGKPYRSQGYGKELYRHALDYARSVGATRIESSMRPTEDAQRVWQSLGAETFQDRGLTRYRLPVQEEREMSGQRGLFGEPDENGIMNFGPQPGEAPAPKGWSEIEGRDPALFAPREAEVKREQETNDAALLKARLEAQFKSGMAMHPGKKAAPEETGSLFGPPAAEAPQRGLFEQPAAAAPAAPADKAWEQPVQRTTYDDLNRAWVDHPSTPKIINSAESEIVRRGMLSPDAVRQMRTRVRDLLQSGPAADAPRTAEIYARQLQKYLRGEPSIINSDRLPSEPHRLPPPEQVQRIEGPRYKPGLTQEELIQQAVAEPAVVGSEHYPAVRLNGQAMHLLQRIIAGKGDGFYTKGFLGPPEAGQQIIDRLGKEVNRRREAARQEDQSGNPKTAAIFRYQADVINKLREVFVQNKVATNSGHVLVFQAGMDRSPEAIEGTLKHELDHLVQYQATGDPDLHVGPDYYDNPETALAANGMRTGNPGYAKYSPNMLALEIGARLMQPGAWKQMGLTDAQAEAAAEHYIDHLVARHGINRVRSIISRVYNAIGKPNAYNHPDTPANRGLEAEVAEGNRRPGTGRETGPPRVPEKDHGDLFGNDPGTPVEQIERPRVSEEIEQQPPEDEEKQFVEAAPSTSGNGRAGPDNGPILGGDLSGGIPPEILEGLNTVRRTMGERVAEHWKESRDNVARAEANRQRVAAARAKGLVPPEELMRGLDLRYWFTAERDAWTVAALQDLAHGKEPLSKLEQEALTLYRDFKSRPGELRQWQMSNHPSIPLEGGAPPNERIVRGTRNPDQLETMQKNRAHVLDWIDKNMDLIDLALKPTKAMLAADKELDEVAGHTLREGQNQNMLKSTIKPENYVPHMYMEDDPERPLYDNAPVAKGNITSRFEFGEERQHPTMLDGIAHGLSPRTMNAFDLFSIHADKFATARATRMLTRSLSNSPTTPGMWAPSARSPRVPEGYVPLGPDTDLFKYTTPNGIPLRYFVPKWVADAMQPITQPNMLRHQIPLMNWTRQRQARIKEMALSFSLFHVHAMNLEMLNSLSGLNPASYGTVLKTLGTGMFSRQWMQDPEFQKNERDMVQAGGTTALSGQMIDAYRGLEPAEAASLWDTKVWKQPVINLLPTAAKKITRYTFNQVQRYYKVMDYSLKRDRWMAEHPDASQREIMQAKRTLGTYVNNVYGGLHAENLGISKATMDISRALLLAPDWQFANAGQLMQNFQQKGKHWRESYRKGYRKDYWKGTWTNATPGAQHMRAYWLKAGLHAYFGSQLIGHVISGKWNPDPLHHPFDIYLGKDKEGKDMYVSGLARGALADTSRLVTAIATRDIGALAGFAVSKSAPGVKEGIELTTGRDWQGKETVNPNLSWGARNLRRTALMLPGMIGTPYSVRPLLESGLNHLLPENERKKETERSFDDIFLSIMGLTQPYKHVIPQGMRMNRLGFLEPRPERQISSKPAWRQAVGNKP